MQPYIIAGPGDPDVIPPAQFRRDPTETNDSVLIGKRAVVVEDEGITQMQLRRTLKGAGVIVVASATSGEEGVEVVLRERPDLVLMDIRMPGAIDGIEATRRILAEYRVCVVMLTAFSDAEYREAAADLRVCDYIVKPVTSDLLLPRLAAAMRRFDVQ
jgi:AmiR/NasT family two-component response regulator